VGRVAAVQDVLVTVFSQVFGFFALFLGPAYLPLTVLPVEPGSRRRRIHQTLLVTGSGVAVFICGSMTRSPLQTHLTGGHLCIT